MKTVIAPQPPLPAPPEAPLSNGLSLKRVAINTYHENVAHLHRDCAVVRAEGFQALSKVEVHANGSSILATLNVVDDASIVCCHELGVSEDAFAQLKTPDGHAARVSQAEPPASIPALFRKINGERLDLAFARQALERASGYRLGSADELPQVFVEF